MKAFPSLGCGLPIKIVLHDAKWFLWPACVLMAMGSTLAEDSEEIPLPVESASQDLFCKDPAGPHWADVLNARIKAGDPMPPWPKGTPLDHVTKTANLSYWRGWREGEKAPLPTPAIMHKLLDAVLADPSLLNDLLRFLPETETAARQIAAMLSTLPSTTEESLRIHQRTRAWIYLHSGLMRDKVLDDVHHADWERYQHNERPDWALDAFLKREPKFTLQLLAGLTKDENPGLATVAARLLFERADAESAPQWRARLMAAAANPEYPATARDIAVNALLRSSWKGRDAWIRESLTREDKGDPEWFIREMWDTPEHWVPILTKMVGENNPIARERAAHLLSRYQPTVQTLKPLLPWLENHEWGGRNAGWHRLMFVQNLSEVRLPTAVPGLMHVLKTETEDSLIAAVASALAFQGAKEGVPAMKAALTRADVHWNTDDIVEALHRLHGLSHQEIVSAMERYFVTWPTTGQPQDVGNESPPESPAPELWIGRYFVKNHPSDPELRIMIGKRVMDLAPTRPQLASNLIETIVADPSPHLSAACSAVLAQGWLTSDSLEPLLRRCKRRGWNTDPFKPLVNRTGAVGAYAAVLARDTKTMTAILRGNDVSAQIAVMAAAFISGDKLDVSQVAKFLDSENKPLAESADDYLWQRDDAESRRAALEHDRNAPGDDTTPWHPTKDSYGRHEDSVRKAMAQFALHAGPHEIFSMIRSSEGGTDNEWTVLCYPDFGIALRDDHDGRWGSAKLDRATMDRLRNYVKKYRVDSLPPLRQPIVDGVHYSYTHATKDDIRRVWMNNPPTAEPSEVPSITFCDGDVRFSKGIVIYGQLVNLFEEIFDEAQMKLSYGNGVEILVPREQGEITSVWKQGNDLRVRLERYGEGCLWRGVDINTHTLTHLVPEPDLWRGLFLSEMSYPGFINDSNRPAWQVRTGNGTIRSGRFRDGSSDDTQGLWRCIPDKKPELVAKGRFGHELTSPDGKWCVASKATNDVNWAAPHGGVRINLTTGETFPINLPAADDFTPLGYVESTGEFLIFRRRNTGTKDSGTGPDEAERHLLNPATGALRKTDGTFWFFFHDKCFRPLQSATAPDEIWAADGGIYSGSFGTKIETTLYRHHTRDFTRRTIMTIQGVGFDSMAMWVDEVEGMVYAVANGDLVRFRLKH